MEISVMSTVGLPYRPPVTLVETGLHLSQTRGLKQVAFFWTIKSTFIHLSILSVDVHCLPISSLHSTTGPSNHPFFVKSVQGALLVSKKLDPVFIFSISKTKPSILRTQYIITSPLDLRVCY